MATIRHHCRTYLTAVEHYPGRARVAYASKAFLCTALAQIILQEGLDLDVVSGGELYVARQAAFPANRIHYHGNGKTQAELAQALDVGIGRIVIDSHQEIQSISQLAAAKGTRVRAWIRVSPDIDAHTHHYRKTGILDTKFGFPIGTGAAMQAIQEAIRNPRIELVGLHAHIGSQIAEIEPFVQTVEALVALGAEAQQLGFRLQELSPGGGLAIPYKTDSKAPSIDSYVQEICTALVQSCKKNRIPLPTLVLEPGRSIVGTAGVALYRVLARKEIPEVRTYISVDGGIADNPRPALYQAAYTALLANKANRAPAETATIAGRFCESGDVLVRDVMLGRAETGDIIAVPGSGAYQLSMSSNYNLVPRPAVVLIDNGRAHLVVRRENYRDLVQRDVPLNLRDLQTENGGGKTR
jgi:diaminopimelate decarboxylase